MRKSLMLFLIVLVSQLVTLADVANDCTDCKPFFGGLPLVSSSGPVATESLTVLENRTYVVGYSDARMNPLWVCYRVYDVALLQDTAGESTGARQRGFQTMITRTPGFNVDTWLRSPQCTIAMDGRLFTIHSY
jgi:hypothetical protein